MYWSASQSTLHAGCNQFWMRQCVRSSVLMFWPYQWCSRHCVLDTGSQTNGVQDRCMSLCGYSWCCTVAPGAIHQFCRCVDAHFNLPLLSMPLFCLSSYQLLAAELLRMLPLRCRMHCMTMSYWHHPSTHFGTNWRLSWSTVCSAVSIIVDLVVFLITKATVKILNYC